jgi:3'(2'), 5'-bisphosphate nucleotidase
MSSEAGPERLLDELVAVARQAGQAILDVYGGEFEVVRKDDASPLTQADLASHRIICERLSRMTPDIPLLSEESGAIDFQTRAAWRRYWLIDPLDGTKEFVNRNGEFTVNIALIEDHDPLLGIVHVPVSGVTYTGLVNRGATRQDPGQPPQAISVRRPCADPPVIVGSRSHANPMLNDLLAPLGDYEMVSMGSSLKFCLLAEGKADFYPRLGPTSEWDTAAAHAIVKAAGGKIVTLENRPLQYNLEESLLNPEFLVIADPDRDWLSLFEGYRT